MIRLHTAGNNETIRERRSGGVLVVASVNAA